MTAAKMEKAEGKAGRAPGPGVDLKTFSAEAKQRYRGLVERQARGEVVGLAELRLSLAEAGHSAADFERDAKAIAARLEAAAAILDAGGMAAKTGKAEAEAQQLRDALDKMRTEHGRAETEIQRRLLRAEAQANSIRADQLKRQGDTESVLFKTRNPEIVRRWNAAREQAAYLRVFNRKDGNFVTERQLSALTEEMQRLARILADPILGYWPPEDEPMARVIPERALAAASVPAPLSGESWHHLGPPAPAESGPGD